MESFRLNFDGLEIRDILIGNSPIYLHAIMES